jgi:hypothetical protein
MADARGNHGEPADKPFLARKAQAELAGQVAMNTGAPCKCPSRRLKLPIYSVLPAPTHGNRLCLSLAPFSQGQIGPAAEPLWTDALDMAVTGENHLRHLSYPCLCLCDHHIRRARTPSPRRTAEARCRSRGRRH